MDKLSAFFTHFTLSARVFLAGRLCGMSGDHATATAGHLHVLRSGALNVLQPTGPPITLTEPSVLFYPQPCLHRFQASPDGCTEIVCAFVEFGADMLNPLMQALPAVIIFPLAALPQLAPVADLLFTEAFGNHAGRQTAVDRLAEYFLVLLLRAALEARLIQGGVLLALSDPRLAQAIAAMHERPEKPWTLTTLALAAGMSRSRFAQHFRHVVGVTPFDYLAAWRWRGAGFA